jgi:hypothetical protein
MDIGIIKNRAITKNRDGDANRIMLQVELLDDDVRTVELMSQAGEDTNPATGCRVYVIGESEAYKLGIAVSDDLEPEVDPGEKEIYSTNNPATTKMARIKLDATGNIVINEGTNHVTQNEALQIAINTFLSALNSQLTGLGAPGGLTLDISTAEVTTVRVP